MEELQVLTKLSQVRLLTSLEPSLGIRQEWVWTRTQHSLTTGSLLVDMSATGRLSALGLFETQMHAGTG